MTKKPKVQNRLFRALGTNTILRLIHQKERKTIAMNGIIVVLQ